MTDVLEVPLRTGTTLQNKILRMLPAGTAVEVLGPEEEGHTRVRGKGVEGWVLTRFLVDQPSARERLAAAEDEAARLKAQLDELD